MADTARRLLIKEFPQYSNLIDSDKGWKIVDTFVGDVLSEKGISAASIFHRLGAEKQKEILGKARQTSETLFENLPESLIQFYHQKLKRMQSVE